MIGKSLLFTLALLTLKIIWGLEGMGSLLLCDIYMHYFEETLQCIDISSLRYANDTFVLVFSNILIPLSVVFSKFDYSSYFFTYEVDNKNSVFLDVLVYNLVYTSFYWLNLEKSSSLFLFIIFLVIIRNRKWVIYILMCILLYRFALIILIPAVNVIQLCYSFSKFKPL